MIVSKIDASCTHCGLPVPKGLVEPGQPEQFCCNGCSTAYQLIHGSGLESFYRMVDSSGEQQTLRSRSASESDFEVFDESSFLERFTHPASDGCRETKLGLDGIHCAACVWLVEKLPMIAPGVVESQVNWSRGTVRVVWQSDAIALSQIAETLYRLGYRPYPVRTSEKAKRREQENRRHLIRIGIAAAAAGNNMLIAASLYLGMFSYMSTNMEWMLRVASCVVGFVAFLGPGRVFLQGAASAIRTRTPHMDLPIALGLTVGSIAGLINTIRGAGEVYFDSLTVLIFLLLVGRWIQFRQQNRAADAIELLYRMTPQRTRRVSGNTIEEVSVEDIQVGEIVEIRAGDMVPVDAIVTAGNSDVDEAILSGESRPAEKQIGDRLAAGTKNLTSVLRAQTTAIGQQTRISRIVDQVEKAANDKPEIVQWANRIGGYFVTTVLFLAIVTFLYWFSADPTLAVDRSVALLIVACPCALALATPLAISVALGRLAKRKIMVKSGDVLQSLYRPGMIWLDKTGTLTEGKMKIVKWFGDTHWIEAVGKIESKIVHPVAEAFVEYARSQAHGRQQEIEIDDIQTLPGGVICHSGEREFVIGNKFLLLDRNIDLKGRFELEESEILADGLSPCWIAFDGAIVGLAGIGDQIRHDARQMVQELSDQGWQVGVLSGDHPEVVNAVAKQLKIDQVHAGVHPEGKLAIIEESNRYFETVVMVGDGVNDSVALASATVGIAVRNGAEASLAAAPVYLARDGLKAINSLMESSRSTCQTIRLNFAASLGYNVIGATLAMVGWINPLLAAVLMPISSLTVIAISLRATRS